MYRFINVSHRKMLAKFPQEALKKSTRSILSALNTPILVYDVFGASGDPVYCPFDYEIYPAIAERYSAAILAVFCSQLTATRLQLLGNETPERNTGGLIQRPRLTLFSLLANW